MAFYGTELCVSFDDGFYIFLFHIAECLIEDRKGGGMLIFCSMKDSTFVENRTELIPKKVQGLLSPVSYQAVRSRTLILSPTFPLVFSL